MKKYLLWPLLFVLTFGISCTPQPETDLALEIIESVRADFAPDRRVAVFDIESTSTANQIKLSGETNLPEVRDTLVARFSRVGLDLDLADLTMLPDPDLGAMIHGLITISVGNIRSEPSHSAELSTQALLGTPLNVLKKDGGFYYVQTPDGYLGWIDSGGLELISGNDLDAYHAVPKIIFLEPFGLVHENASSDSPVVSDIVAGALLEYTGTSSGFYSVRFPDDRTGFISSSLAVPFSIWLDTIQPDASTLIETAFAFTGAPYLWGGTSSKGMDCSGFTKTVFYLNGMILPRDASQQIAAGTDVESDSDFSSLEPGDLLFFGRKATEDSKERVVHVAMWIGNNEYIHSSGRVMVNSMDPEAENFDEYNFNRYLRSRRILNESSGIQFLQTDGLFKAARALSTVRATD